MYMRIYIYMRIGVCCCNVGDSGPERCGVNLPQPQMIARGIVLERCV